ncbi:ABC transporter ATP-binding protein [Paenibacillus turpanensis]|uniref:ABC transporter ATP-binding protein n=1 Tax=Paenibacillus turpanensis TaxID=2689078 RepID=UPI00140CFC07|nr:ATP-binding cassette domain-containing protein [Paenibacillus turpanensis]
MLEAAQLAYRYEQRGAWLFRALNLTLEAGELLGLTGPSGSGKTTLARILAGYERPGEGSVLLDGNPLPANGYHPVQLVMQHPEKAVNPRWKMDRIVREGWDVDDATLSRLGIEREWLTRWPGELSGGELQRFCIARALGPQTQYLIADEMTTMLDAITQAQIWHAVLDIARERSIGVLVISHDQALAKRLCHRIVDWKDISLGQS